MFKALDDTQYGHYSNFNEGGGRIFYESLLQVLPLIVAFFGKEKLKELWPKSDYIVNLSILGFVFMVISSRNWIFARFDVYFGLYNLILISWIIKLFSKHDRKIIYYLLLGCYLIYFYYEQVISLNIVYLCVITYVYKFISLVEKTMVRKYGRYKKKEKQKYKDFILIS